MQQIPMWIARFALVFLFAMPVLPAHAADPVAGEILLDLQSSTYFQKYSGGESLYFPGLLSQFYATRGYAPVWVNAHGPQLAAGQMLAAVRASYRDGLRPDDYHLPALDHLNNHFRYLLTRGPKPKSLAALELLLSDAFLRLAADEMQGRTAALGSQSCGELLRQLQVVAGGVDPGVLIRSLAPQGDGYQGMQVALARYRVLEAEATLPDVPSVLPLRRGDRGPRVAILIRHLQAEGDLAPGDYSAQFGPEVAAAVKKFQLRHGLARDGVTGLDTLQWLNQPPTVWINRLRVNMERLRRLPRHPPVTRLVVNVADYRATLFDQDQAVMIAKVIVGQPGRQTPEFNDWIRYLVVNPAWDVPPSIASEELLSDVQKHPGYLARHGYEVLQGWGADEHAVDPASVDWNKWNQQTLPYHFRQKPGPENPLGRIKFMFPNHYDVYLHDTPAQDLFGASQCTFSHGCIRVAHAMQLAEDLLRLDGQAQPSELLKAAVASGETRRIDLTHPIPIYIVYLTAWGDASGMLESRRDIYDRDPQVLSLLDAPVLVNPKCSLAPD